MRVFFGMVLGVMLTVGAAYLYDSTAGAGTPTAAARPMVNWDVVSLRFEQAQSGVREQWSKLTAQ